MLLVDWIHDSGVCSQRASIPNEMRTPACNLLLAQQFLHHGELIKHKEGKNGLRSLQGLTRSTVCSFFRQASGRLLSHLAAALVRANGAKLCNFFSASSVSFGIWSLLHRWLNYLLVAELGRGAVR